MKNTKKGRNKTKFQNSVNSEEMANKELNVIKTPAFGRPFRLGMLYDREQDNIIPGETLLTMEDMENHIYKEKRGGCSSEIIFEDSLEQKSTAYKGDANLELNMLKGTVELGASGNFLKNDMSTKKELKMSLTAEYVMMYKELEMKPLQSRISNTKTNATHIVTAIEYGKKVTFTFNRSISKDEDVLEISGELKGKLEKIPCIKIAGKISGGMKASDSKTNEKISCKYCGDVILPENPTTYEEAVVCYRKLPYFFKESDDVPVTVWLYPIPKQSTPGNKVLQKINKEEMKQAVILLEDLQRIFASCNDVMSGHAYALIPEVRSKIGNFRRNMQAFQEEFQDHALGKLLKEDNRTTISMSPWREKIAAFTQWISQKGEREIDLLNVYINEIKKNNIEILQVSSVDAKLFEHDNVMILDIGLPFSAGQHTDQREPEREHREEPREEHREEPREEHREEPREEPREEHREEPREEHREEPREEPRIIPENCWYTNDRIKIDVRRKIKSLVELNSEGLDKDNFFKFFVTLTDINQENEQRIQAFVYKKGEVKEENFNILLPVTKAVQGLEDIMNRN